MCNIKISDNMCSTNDLRYGSQNQANFFSMRRGGEGKKGERRGIERGMKLELLYDCHILHMLGLN